MLLEILQNLQENTCALGLQLHEKRVSDTGFYCELSEISKNTFFCRTALVAASDIRKNIILAYEAMVFFPWLCIVILLLFS